MTPFIKYWITATLVPESVQIIKSNENGTLLKIINEDKTKQVAVLEFNPKYNLVAIGKGYEDLLNSKHYTFSQACAEISKILGLVNVSELINH